MNQLWERLDTVLTEMLELYRALLTLSKQKREMLVKVQVQDIEAMTKREEALILQVGKLEGLREQVVADISKTSQLPPESLNLIKIRDLVDEAKADRFVWLDKEFDNVLQELTQLNKLNTELIQQSLGFINYNLNLLTQSQVGPTYAAKGQSAQNTPARGLVDRKV